MSNNTDNNMQETKPDIFDKIMHLPGLRVFEPLYKKYKEVLRIFLRSAYNSSKYWFICIL